MNLQKAGMATLALACALSLGSMLPPRAQAQIPAGYDSSSWQAPRGYDLAYPEHGTPNMVARQGYSAGFNEGQADLSQGKKFSPTENKAYSKAVIPKGMDKGEFRQQFRQAFVKGYSNGYKGESH